MKWQVSSVTLYEKGTVTNVTIYDKMLGSKKAVGNCETLSLKFCIVQIYKFHQIHLIVIKKF